MLRRAAAGTVAAGVGGVALVYWTQPGFKRSVDFWSRIGPTVAEYQAIKAQASFTGSDAGDQLKDFHKRTASKSVAVILELGGIYVKLGQILSTVGAGILNDVYIDALVPLQDGVPPRSLEEIGRIVEASTGESMDSLFESFDPEPVGAASIAQAHRATLRGGQRVIVKVQYPEVATLFEADFDNLEIITRFLFPENIELVRGLRRRHQGELDFRKEAEHLDLCRRNMQLRGFEPSLLRIPAVLDPRLCTQHTLAMEFLDGVSMNKAIEAEHEDLARALGYKGGGEELREKLMGLVRDHFEKGGGAEDRLFGIKGGVATLTDTAPLWGGLLRRYAVCRRTLRNGVVCVHNLGVGCVQGLGAVLGQPQWQLQPWAFEDGAPVGASDLGSVLTELIRVHGCQLLLDGVYNADPHPGNVLLLPDGRLGLIDYGMVGRLGLQERLNIARVIVALADGHPDEVARLYKSSGYQACWHSGKAHCDAVVYRIATFHLDRIDLSSVETDVGTMSIQSVLQSTLETSVPDWIEQSRRLGGLLIGVASQAGRPVSLAKEWKPLALELLRQHAGEDEGKEWGRQEAAAQPLPRVGRATAVPSSGNSARATETETAHPTSDFDRALRRRRTEHHFSAHQHQQQQRNEEQQQRK